MRGAQQVRVQWAEMLSGVPLSALQGQYDSIVLLTTWKPDQGYANEIGAFYQDGRVANNLQDRNKIQYELDELKKWPAINTKRFSRTNAKD